MRLFKLFTALVLGALTPVAASALSGGSPFGMVSAAELSASVSKLSAADTATATAAATAAPAESVKSVDTQITDWVAQLSKEPGFDAWKQASWTKYPIGPGKRGWVVIVKDGDSGLETGYMVVVENEDGTVQLEEYGVGEMPLFSKRTLQWALASDGLENVKFTQRATFERVYVDALHAYWKVSEGETTRFADAKSGAWLPITEQDLGGLKAASAIAGLSEGGGAAKSLHMFAKNVADPYMNIAWITAKPLPIHSWNDVMQSLKENETSLVYRADLFGGMMVYPFGVAGVHSWKPNNDEAANGYVALEQEGLRYVPFQRLLENGTFRH